MIKGVAGGRPYGTEKQIQTAILAYLCSRGILPVHHRNTGDIVRNRAGQIRFGRSWSTLNQRGAPDVLFTYLGKGVALEVKTPIGRLSPDQRDWLNRFQAPPNEGLVIVARSVDDAEAALKKMEAGETWKQDL